jgi:hypothetical protein
MHHYGAGIFFMGCYCDGNDYAGTPTLAFNYKNKTEILDVEQASKQFIFDPNEYVLYPKIDDTDRTMYCDNSVWNIDNQAEMTGKEVTQLHLNFDSKDSIAFGQVLIRKYGLYVTFGSEEVLGTPIASYRVKPGQPIPTWIWYKITASLLLGLAAIGIMILTRMKIQRVEKEK